MKRCTTFAIDRLLVLGARADQPDRWDATPLDAMSRLGPRARALVPHMIACGAVATPAHYGRLGDVSALQRLTVPDPPDVADAL